MTTTKDRISQAKSALLFALRSAEGELCQADIKKLEAIIGKTESLQVSMRPAKKQK